MSECDTFNVCRGVLDHPVFAREPFTEREAWLWLIAEAQWKPVRKRVGRLLLNLERGQLAHSVRFMAAAWKWAPARVHRFLHRLQAEAMVRLKSETLAIRITICNYDDHQLAPAASETVARQSRDKLNTDLPPPVPSGEVRSIAIETATKVWQVFGFDPDFVPPRWYGLAGWLEAGMRGVNRRASTSFVVDVTARRLTLATGVWSGRSNAADGEAGPRRRGARECLQGVTGGLVAADFHWNGAGTKNC